jgi:hypothetical protein
MKPRAALSAILLTCMLSLASAAAAQTGGSAPCLSEREVQAVTTWLLPDGIDGLARRCRTALPTRSFLATSGAALAERYRGESDGEADAAKRALSRVAGNLPLSLFGDDVPGTLIVEAALQQMNSGDCVKADRLASLLSPLPRASIGEVAAMLIATGLRNADAGALPIRLCGATR